MAKKPQYRLQTLLEIREKEKEEAEGVELPQDLASELLAALEAELGDEDLDLEDEEMLPQEGRSA